MPANNEYPVLNGIAPSWADVVVRISPEGGPLIDMKDIKSINTGVTVEVGEKRAGGRLMKRTTGSESSEASMTLYREGFQTLLRQLKDLAPRRGSQALVSLVHFQIDLQFTPPGSVDVFQTIVQGCRLMGRSLNSAEGTDADVVEVALNPMKVIDVIDGVEVVML